MLFYEIEDFERDSDDMGTDFSVFRDDVLAFFAAWLQLDGSCWLRAAAMCRAAADIDRTQVYMDLSLCGVCALECVHDFLGLQRDRRRGDCCHNAEFSANARGLSHFQRLAVRLQGHSSLHFARSWVDCVGKGLF